MAGHANTTQPTVMRSEGQRMLLAVQGSLAAIAHDIGCKDAETVRAWKLGTKLPTPALRAAMEREYGIPARAWSIRPGAPLSPPSDAALPPPSGAAVPTSLEDCLATLADLRRDRAAELTPSDRIRLSTAMTNTLTLRAKLEQAAELAEARYVTHHPSWIKLKRAIAHALEKYPDAARAVADAIERIEAQP